MPFREMIKIIIQPLVYIFPCEKPKVGLKGFVLQYWFDVPHNAHQQQMEHIDIGFGLSFFI